MLTTTFDLVESKYALRDFDDEFVALDYDAQQRLIDVLLSIGPITEVEHYDGIVITLKHEHARPDAQLKAQIAVIIKQFLRKEEPHV
jgi:hypothetical protein